MRGRKAQWEKWEEAKDSETPERAYSMLEVPADIDDGMLVTNFSMRVSTSFVSGAGKVIDMWRGLVISRIRCVGCARLSRSSRDEG